MLDRLKRGVADRFAGVIQREIRESGAVTGETLELRLDVLGSRVAGLESRIGWVEGELGRMGPHIAAQGERIGVVEQGYRPAQDPQVQAAAVEHARARARGMLISEYEERLNRLEAEVRSHIRG